MVRTSISEFRATLEQEAPADCAFSVGDKVAFTNSYGVRFDGHTVIGFAGEGDRLNNRFIYIDYDCFWFPCTPESLEAST